MGVDLQRRLARFLSKGHPVGNKEEGKRFLSTVKDFALEQSLPPFFFFFNFQFVNNNENCPTQPGCPKPLCPINPTLVNGRNRPYQPSHKNLARDSLARDKQLGH